MGDDAAAKAAWLEERRREHCENFRRRSVQAAEPEAKAAEPDDAAMKREWLRQRRMEHGAKMRSREREMTGSAASPYPLNAAPLVDASLLSTPSERELYLRYLAEERMLAQRERSRMDEEARRRPSFSMSGALDDSLIRYDEVPDDSYAANYGERWAWGHGVWGGKDVDGETSAENSTTTSAAEREAEEMSELEAIETLRLHEMNQERRSSSGSLKGGLGGGGYSGDSPRLRRSGRLQMSGPGILPPNLAPASASGARRRPSSSSHASPEPPEPPEDLHLEDEVELPHEPPAAQLRGRGSYQRAEGLDGVGRPPMLDGCASSPMLIPRHHMSSVPSLSLGRGGEAWAERAGGGEGDWMRHSYESPHSANSSPGRVLRLEDITIIKRR